MIHRATAVCVFTLTCLLSISAQASDPDGIWARDDGNARVKIAPCGAKLCATNLWIKDTSKGEEVGDRLIMSLERKSDTELSGTAFDPKRDRTYSMTLIIGKNGLITRGCIIGGLLCRDVNWAPVK
jgi:uncharacterized protein (DUF2147 family)